MIEESARSGPEPRSWDRTPDRRRRQSCSPAIRPRAKSRSRSPRAEFPRSEPDRPNQASCPRRALRRCEHFDRARHSLFGNRQSAPHQPQFSLVLCFSFRPEKSVRCLHAESSCPLIRRAKPSGKLAGTTRRAHSALAQEMRKHFLERRRLLRVSLHFAFELAVGQNLVGLACLRPRSISRSLSTIVRFPFC